ncbi:hypothetical protein WJX74_006282 [Apatococcus lobatus]|uniref:Uncharacterized protein n=1 Tax=Apatococcus lobatus TaxID=904363 RepID=A0AAW1R0V3_9CHLO
MARPKSAKRKHARQSGVSVQPSASFERDLADFKSQRMPVSFAPKSAAPYRTRPLGHDGLIAAVHPRAAPAGASPYGFGAKGARFDPAFIEQVPADQGFDFGVQGQAQYPAEDAEPPGYFGREVDQMSLGNVYRERPPEYVQFLQEQFEIEMGNRVKHMEALKEASVRQGARADQEKKRAMNKISGIDNNIRNTVGLNRQYRDWKARKEQETYDLEQDRLYRIEQARVAAEAHRRQVKEERDREAAAAVQRAEDAKREKERVRLAKLAADAEAKRVEDARKEREKKEAEAAAAAAKVLEAKKGKVKAQRDKESARRSKPGKVAAIDNSEYFARLKKAGPKVDDKGQTIKHAIAKDRAGYTGKKDVQVFADERAKLAGFVSSALANMDAPRKAKGKSKSADPMSRATVFSSLDRKVQGPALDFKVEAKRAREAAEFQNAMAGLDVKPCSRKGVSRSAGSLHGKSKIYSSLDRLATGPTADFKAEGKRAREAAEFQKAMAGLDINPKKARKTARSAGSLHGKSKIYSSTDRVKGRPAPDFGSDLAALAEKRRAVQVQEAVRQAPTEILPALKAPLTATGVPIPLTSAGEADNCTLDYVHRKGQTRPRLRRTCCTPKLARDGTTRKVCRKRLLD